MTFTSTAERVVLCGVWQVRSFVGLIPLFATLTIEEATLDKLPAFKCVGGIPYFSRCRHWHTLTHACVCRPQATIGVVFEVQAEACAAIAFVAYTTGT